MADRVIPRMREASAGDGLAPRRQPPLGTGNISEARQKLAARNLVLYQNKRNLINALEALDIVDDAILINKIATSLPARVWAKPERQHWRK